MTKPDHRPALLQLLGNATPFPLTEGEIARDLHAYPGDLRPDLDALSLAGLIERDVTTSAAAYVMRPDQELAARHAYARLTGEQPCRECGCTESWACDGGCSWAESDLCDACVERAEEAQLLAQESGGA